MDRVTEHVAAHPYYLQGIADERKRIVEFLTLLKEDQAKRANGIPRTFQVLIDSILDDRV